MATPDRGKRTCTAATSLPRQRTSTLVTEVTAAPGKIRLAVREIALIAGLFLVYKLGRLLTSGDAGEATDNAGSVWHGERRLHLPSELSVQQALLGHDGLITAANSYYAYVHFPATVAALIWLYVSRPALYRYTRRIIAWLTATALVVHLLFPLAPPRLVPATGMVDTGTLYGPSVYGPPATDTLSNQYAAMPSLHVGWSLAVAGALIAAAKGRWRWLWLAHPLITLLVVVVTGNHYWLDAIAAVSILAGAAALVLGYNPHRLLRGDVLRVAATVALLITVAVLLRGRVPDWHEVGAGPG